MSGLGEHYEKSKEYLGVIDIVVVGDSPATVDLGQLSTIVLSIVTFLWAVVWSVWLYRRSRVTEYWFNSVIGPETIRPILDFYSKWDLIFQDNKNFNSISTAVKTINTFGIEKDKLISQVWLSKLLFNDFYEFVCQELDVIEDYMATEIGGLAKHSSHNNISFQDCSVLFQSTILKILHSIGTMEPKFQKPNSSI